MARKRKHTRGPRGDGYTTYDKRRKRWRAVYGQSSKYFTREADADAWRAQQKAIAETPPDDPRAQLLHIALFNLIESKRHYRPGTRRVAISLARTIVAVLGNKPVGQITQADVAAMDLKNRETLSISSCEAMLTLLSTLFHRLVVLEVLTRNPVDQYRTLTSEKARGGTPARKPIALAPSEIQRFLAALDGDPYQPVFIWLCVLPFRVSELRGLAWSNVDVLRGIVRVVEQRSNDYPDAAPLKNDASVRDLPVPLRLISLVPRLPSHLNLVFPNRRGRELRSDVLRDHAARALKLAELPYMHLHDFRHTSSGGILNIGTPEHMVQALLGHAPNTMTRHYARPTVEAMRPYVEAWCDLVLAQPNSKIVRLDKTGT